MMSIITVSIICIQLIVGSFADRMLQEQTPQDKWELKKFEGQYVWHATEFDKFKRQEQASGFVEEYTTKKKEFCHSSIQLPGVSLMNEWFMGAIYLLILLYFFLGIAIVADLFMEAIEVITSKKTVVTVEDPNNLGQMIEVERNVWNPTIANLTLMALGSSMPEILLSVFSTVVDLDADPSPLGPAAIVGSASFNLFVISAISIASVGDKPKKIFDVRVFIWTALMSTWAYVWFFLVLSVITPNYVELWEAILTFAQFAILCIVAYGCDRWTGSKVAKEEGAAKIKVDSAKLALRKVAETIGNLHVVEMGMDILPKGRSATQMEDIQRQFAIILGTSYLDPITMGNKEDNVEGAHDAIFEELMNVLSADSLLERMVYKKQVAKQTTGFKRTFVKPPELKDMTGQIEMKTTVKSPSLYVSFQSTNYSVSEKAGKVKIVIKKVCEEEFQFRIVTRADTAIEEKDFVAIESEVTIKAEQKEHCIEIEVHNDPECTPDKDFFVTLMDMNGKRLKGEDTECKVTIIDTDNPGVLGFVDRMAVVRPRDKVMFLTVHREKGADGDIACEVCIITEDPLLPGKPAQAGIDYDVPSPLMINFKAGESSANIKIDMPGTSILEEEIEQNDSAQKGEQENMAPSISIADEKNELKSKADQSGATVSEEPVSVHFIVELRNPTGQAILSKKKSCFVEIRPQSQATDEAIAQEQQNMLKHFMLGENPTWGYQFMLAVQLGPTITEEGVVDDVTCGEAIYHFMAVPWRLIFAIVPPRHIWGGWAAFLVALSLIGVVTFLVGEIAGLLGCYVGLRVSVTAITLVALGTSLPDTFASKAAAVNSEYADAAIGNVTGSNAVNVFLGMGLPWLIVTIYKQVKFGEPARVPAGDLSFSVIVFICCSVVTFFTFFLRRVIIGGELGGPPASKYSTALLLVFLWVTYIVLCTCKAYEVFDQVDKTTAA